MKLSTDHHKRINFIQCCTLLKLRIMKQKLIDRIDEMKKQSSMRFAKRTYFGENMNDIDINNIDEDKLLGLFEQMVRIHYTQM